MNTHDYINELIKDYHGLDKGKISDGYHTFNELYEHRIELFITLCKFYASVASEYNLEEPWKSTTHSDNSIIEGWFVMGINSEKGKQITYHLPMSKWEDCKLIRTLDKAPEWDGHTSADVLERLKTL